VQRFSRPGALELFIPLRECATHGRAQRAEISQLLLDHFELLRSGTSHFAAWRHSAIARTQESMQLAQREPERKGSADQQHALHRAFGVDAKSPAVRWISTSRPTRS